MNGLQSAIVLQDVTKHFGSTHVLQGLNLDVASGEVHGFLGPNGAGKSTTLRVLLGLLHIDGGRAEVLGGDPWRDSVTIHRRLAYVPGDVSLWPRLTGGEAIDVLTGLRGGADKKRRDELIERFDFNPKKRGRTYSKGNRQKVALIAALSADVELLLLDEPTSGLDPLMEQVFAQCVREAKDRGTTVLLSSHILSEVEQLADRVTLIRDGRAVESGSLADLRHLSKTKVVAAFRRPLTSAERESLETAIPEASVDACTLTAAVPANELEGLLRAIGAAGDGLEHFTATPPRLEELFLSHYGQPGRSA